MTRHRRAHRRQLGDPADHLEHLNIQSGEIAGSRHRRLRMLSAHKARPALTAPATTRPSRRRLAVPELAVGTPCSSPAGTPSFSPLARQLRGGFGVVVRHRGCCASLAGWPPGRRGPDRAADHRATATLRRPCRRRFVLRGLSLSIIRTAPGRSPSPPAPRIVTGPPAVAVHRRRSNRHGERYIGELRRRELRSASETDHLLGKPACRRSPVTGSSCPLFRGSSHRRTSN